MRLYLGDSSEVTKEGQYNDLIISRLDTNNYCWDSVRTDTSHFTSSFNEGWIETTSRINNFGLLALASAMPCPERTVSNDTS